MIRSICFFFILSVFTNYAQIQKYKLPKTLKEISGLAPLNDSTLIAINDSGNQAVVYLINTKGELIKTIIITDAKNIDWETLAQGSEYLFIGDVGNNRNQRTNLTIYKVKIDRLIKNDTVKAESIVFSYKNQQEFPPDKKNFIFDCEAMYFKKDTLYLISKIKCRPWDDSINVYQLPVNVSHYKLSPYKKIYIGGKKYFKDAVTGASFTQKDSLIILTYKHLFIKGDKIRLKGIVQRESVCKIKDSIFIAAEAFPFIGKPKLYLLKHD